MRRGKSAEIRVRELSGPVETPLNIEEGYPSDEEIAETLDAEAETYGKIWDAIVKSAINGTPIDLKQ